MYKRNFLFFPGTWMLLFIFLLPALVWAQTDFKQGDRIEVDIMMSGSPENARWQKGTITKVEMWNGQVSGYFIRTDKGQDIVSSANYMRKSTDQTPATGPETNRNGGEKPVIANERAGTQFKAGDRVEVDKIMSNNAANAHWAKGTVKSVDLQNGQYVVVLDDFSELNILIRQDKDWIRKLNDGSTKPAKPTCSFSSPTGTVAKNSPPSAQLFQRVIYNYQNDIKRGYRLGMSFSKFNMGTPFKNIVTQKGRILDFIPTNVMVYPVTAVVQTCEEFETAVTRVVTEIEYSCYQDERGSWICKNGAPREKERINIPKN